MIKSHLVWRSRLALGSPEGINLSLVDTPAAVTDFRKGGKIRFLWKSLAATTNLFTPLFGSNSLRLVSAFRLSNATFIGSSSNTAFCVASIVLPDRTNSGSSKVFLNLSSEWLTADCDTQSLSAAFDTDFSSSTTRNVRNALPVRDR